MVTFNNRLYVHTRDEIFQSTDGGASWQSVRVSAEGVPPESVEQKSWRSGTYYTSKFVVSGKVLYFILPVENFLQIFHLSADGNMLIPVQDVPTFEVERTTRLDFERRDVDAKTKTVAISHNAFYVEYKRKLFKWRLGDPEWINTGLIDASEQPDEDFHKGFKIATSRETVYIGKREGRLLRSLDGGSNWRDITSNLPLDFAHFKEMVFSGSTLYIATDKGVLVSETGEYWRVITDTADTRLIIDQFALDGTEVYGIADTGVYRLNTRRQWEQISSEAPDGMNALAIANSRLYGAVSGQGIFNMSLENMELRANAEE